MHYRGRSRWVVIAGTLLTDPYTGRRIEFRKAAATEVQIDHLYPLARAWDMGAAQWPLQRRVDFLRCLQVARKYTLPISAADRDASQAITRSCP
ncbi:HNH endonuclease family protein [Kribbella sp. NBC_01484]|uniref:HNH endonuclease domain-containing protein n=1 Tax=Kribbella sp. NBC_01484 TaxID=2903579 RepID=UPI002E340E9C|nr:HNH endonuclease domain-containing protein [Kribbella sp. NBC_01484]